MEYKNELKPSSDRKVQFYPGQLNTFGLLPGPEEGGGTCPDCTTAEGGCWSCAAGKSTETCYVAGLMKVYGGVRGVLKHNTDLLKNADIATMHTYLDREFTRFEDAEARRAARKKVPQQLFYRLHWSGDVFSESYALALMIAMRHHPQIRFWTYTRSFDRVETLLLAPNLRLYLSVDPVNIDRGFAAYDDFVGGYGGRLAVAYMNKIDDFDSKYRDRIRDLLDARNAMRQLFNQPIHSSLGFEQFELSACPVDEGKIPLMGGCSKCQKCLSGKDIWFKT